VNVYLVLADQGHPDKEPLNRLLLSLLLLLLLCWYLDYTRGNFF